MIRLFAAEASRLVSRRFTLVALLLVLLGVGAFQLVVNGELQPASPAEQAASQAQFDEQHRYWEANEASCATQGDQPDCRYPEPQLADYSLSQPFDDIVKELLLVPIYLVAMAALMVAGSFIGAEYTSGSIGNWLSFVPRRGPVYLSKLGTVVGFGVLVSALASGLALGVAVLLAGSYDLPRTGLGDELALVGRGTLAAVALAVVGFCIGLLGRHTAAAIGALLGYLFIWFVRNAVLVNTEWAQRLTPWTPEANLSAVVRNGYAYIIPTSVVGPEGVTVDYLERNLSLTHGLVYWAVLLGVVVVVTAVVFRRRDIT